MKKGKRVIAVLLMLICILTLSGFSSNAQSNENQIDLSKIGEVQVENPDNVLMNNIMSLSNFFLMTKDQPFLYDKTMGYDDLKVYPARLESNGSLSYYSISDTFHGYSSPEREGSIVGKLNNLYNIEAPSPSVWTGFYIEVTYGIPGAFTGFNFKDCLGLNQTIKTNVNRDWFTLYVPYTATRYQAEMLVQRNSSSNYNYAEGNYIDLDLRTISTR